MGHDLIDKVRKRAEHSKADSDFTYFLDLLLAAEAITKTITVSMLSAIADDKDKNRYRVEHMLIRADGIGDWARAIEDVLTGPASQYLLADAYQCQSELTRSCRVGDWQFEAVGALIDCFRGLSIESEAMPAKTDMKRWFRLLAVLRNKTKAHGAPLPSKFGDPALALERSIDLVSANFSLFERSTAQLYRNLSGKYRVSAICGSCKEFSYLTTDRDQGHDNGVYVWWGSPRKVQLLEAGEVLENYFFANGGYDGKKYELISYVTGDRIAGDAKEYLIPPGELPPSETHERGELVAREKALSNAPELASDYVARPQLEEELLDLLLDNRRHVVTLRGRGGIGKTSLALKVLEEVYKSERYDVVVWLSARDVDLRISGPRAVRPDVISPEDIAELYAALVLSNEEASAKDFDAKKYFEKELLESSVGPCLFVLDNFETTRNPMDMFAWMDNFITLPNKILITTRLRDFKGDYPVDVTGMNEGEALELVERTANYLGISEIVSPTYANEIVEKSEGHPYVIKILLGEVAKNRARSSVPHIIAGSEEILAALFERTYAALSPCSQRAFLTLSAWASAVPKLALEAVLLRSTQERSEVEKGIETLIQYSLVETYQAPSDAQEFLTLPLVAATFGKKKLNIDAHKDSIRGDVELLRMLGPSRRDDIGLGLAKKLENFLTGIAGRIEKGAAFEEFDSMLTMICRTYLPGWLLLARWHLEVGSQESIEHAKQALRAYLQDEPYGDMAAEAWRQLAYACHRSQDIVGEVQAFVERAQLSNITFYDVSNTANKLNGYIREQRGDIDREEKRALALRLLEVMESRVGEADADDLSRMAWLAIHVGKDGDARSFVRDGLDLDPHNRHCKNLDRKLET